MRWRRWQSRKASGQESTDWWVRLRLNRAALKWTIKLYFLWKNKRKGAVVQLHCGPGSDLLWTTSSFCVLVTLVQAGL